MPAGLEGARAELDTLKPESKCLDRGDELCLMTLSRWGEG